MVNDEETMEQPDYRIVFGAKMMEEQRQKELYKFKTILVCTVSSRPLSAISHDCQKRKKINNNNHNKSTYQAKK